jgi:ribosomal-protein-alanine N-acetyltransferase
MPVIRPGEARDLEAVAAIQAASAHAAHWPAGDYLQHQFSVAECEGVVAGFLVWRRVSDDQCEILNLAVAPEFRRRGIARALLAPLLNLRDAEVFLEVRESNMTARLFYNSMGFQEVSVRKLYYDFPAESAIVMKFHSC